LLKNTEIREQAPLKYSPEFSCLIYLLSKNEADWLFLSVVVTVFFILGGGGNHLGNHIISISRI